MKRYLLLSALFILGMATPLRAQVLEGTYAVEGVNSEGTPYTGTAILDKYGQGVYILKWTFTGGRNAEGYGIIQHGVLAVVIKNSEGGISLATYIVEPTGVLIGLWLSPPSTAVFTEALTPR